MSTISLTPILGLLAKDEIRNAFQTFDLEYLNEGGANVVYRITNVQDSKKPEPSSILPALTFETGVDIVLHQKVLRLRKEVADAESVRQNIKDYESVVSTLGHLDPSNEALLLRPTPLRINNDLKLKCSKHLVDLEHAGLRKSHRTGGIAVHEDNAMLLNDMSCGPKQISVEFKLKWLAPSPSAPSGATCCRTCALTAMKIVIDGKTPKVKSCPLGHFVGDDRYRQQLIGELITSEQEKEEVNYEQCLAWLHTLRSTDLIQKLRKAQIALDHKGSLDEEYMAKREFRVAMTLRDCSILAQIPKKMTSHKANTGEFQAVTFAIADLDLKPDSREKRAYWRGIEQRLIDGGFYTLSAENMGAIGIRCLLREYREMDQNGDLG